jgi:cold shock CspA family protein
MDFREHYMWQGTADWDNAASVCGFIEPKRSGGSDVFAHCLADAAATLSQRR